MVSCCSWIWAKRAFILLIPELALFGTLNLDIRSFQLNFELTLLVYDGGFAQQLMALADGYVANSARVSRQEWEQRPTRQRLTENLFQLFSP